MTPDSPRMTCILSNAAIATNWVSASDTSFRTSGRRNCLVPDSYWAVAARYISSSTADVAFYATYEGTNAVEVVRRRNVEGLSTHADPIWEKEETAQTDLLRCVIGNPFRPLLLAPSLLAHNDSLVVRLAQAAYEHRLLPSGELDPARLAILCDALLDAGCQDAGLLGHLRGPGPHTRGCWALDFLLGKE